MSNPIGAILAGLGGGLSSAGQSMDQRAVLQQQLKRQAALDAIARAQKLNEMDLEPADANGSPFANPGAVQPSSIPIQTGMSGGTNPVPSSQPSTPSDLAMRKLIGLPNAQGGIDQFQEKPFADTKEGKAEARDKARQDEQFARQQKLLTQQEQAKAIDPVTMRKALDGDQDAVAQVLTKHPELQTTFNKPAPPPLQHVAPGEGVPDGKGGWTVPIPKSPNDDDKTLYEIADPNHPGQVIRVPRSRAINAPVAPKGQSSIAGTSADVLTDAINKVRSIDPTKFGPIDSDATAGALTKVAQSDEAQQYNTALTTIANAYAAAMSKTGRMSPTAARMAAQAALPGMSDKAGNKAQKWENAKKMAEFVEKSIAGAPGNQAATAPTVPTGKVTAKDLVHAAINGQPMPED